MVEQKICSFCGIDIEPGTGKMHVKKDGTIYLFCSNKCYKNMVDLKRIPRNVEWTRAYAQRKAVSKAEKHHDEKKAEGKVEGKA